MEDGLEDAVTDKADRHPVKSDEYHGAVGVVHDDVRLNAIKHLAEMDEGE